MIWRRGARQTFTFYLTTLVIKPSSHNFLIGTTLACGDAPIQVSLIILESYNSGMAPPDDPFHPFSPDEWTQHTRTQMRTYLIQHLPNPHRPEPVLSGHISSARPTGYSPAAIELMGFRKGF